MSVAKPPAGRFVHVVRLGAASAALYGLLYVAAREIFWSGSSLALLAYYAATIVLVVLYAGLLVRSARGGLSGRARALALAFPVAIDLSLVFGRPYLSVDVFSYIAHGHFGALSGPGVYASTGADLEGTSLGTRLLDFGVRPAHGHSPYGPLWSQLEILVMRFTDDVGTAVWLFKALAAAASLGSAVLIWRILGVLRPAAQSLGTLAYLWNPVVLMEFAGEGHNDALMIFAVLLALLLTLRLRLTSAALASALAVLSKYLPLIFLPLQLAYAWRSRRSTHPAPGLLVGALFGAASAAALYAPLWSGPRTFLGIWEQGERVWHSTSGVVEALLGAFLPEAAAALVTRAALGGAFAATVLLAAWSVRDGASLVRMSAVVALLYVLVASPVYWPWYVAQPIALLALWPTAPAIGLIVALTATSRLVAPLDDLAAAGVVSGELEFWIISVIGGLVPLAAFLAVLVRRRKRADS